MRISIVTITFNAADTLQSTLDSVAMQTYDDVEHLIIDGASKDATLSIAKRYCENASRKEDGHKVIVVSEPDKGIYDAMNKGLKRATGDYICFLNAGDWFPKADILDSVAEAVVSQGEGVRPAVVYGDTDLVDKEGNFISHRRLSPPDNLNWRSFRQGMLVCHQAFYARVDLAKKVSYDTRYRFSADVDWCIRVMKMAEKESAPLCRVNRVLVNYLHEGQTTQNQKKSLMERFDVMRRHYGLASTVVMHAWFVVRAFLKH